MSSKILCRYFMHGACREKENCRYSHDFSNQPSMVCTYYQLGACSYGTGCRYDHIKADRMAGIRNDHSKPSMYPATSFQKSVNPASTSSVSLLHMSSAPARSQMVTLGKNGTLTSPLPELSEIKVAGLPSKMNAEEWVMAAEFIPGQKWHTLAGPSSYLEAVQSGIPTSTPNSSVEEVSRQSQSVTSQELCPYAAHGECPHGTNCQYIHGDICELCCRAVLMPSDKMQNDLHIKECMREHEKSMEAAFAAQSSEDKICGICMEVVWEKTPATAQRFGILSDCTHVFCLACIRKWRSEDQYENQVIRACPECRVKSDFVIPSKFWVENKEDKICLIDTYKMALSKKPCMHFRQGDGQCPFNDKCFYSHTYPDGRKASPQAVRRRQNAEGEVDFLNKPSLWDFLCAANERRMELGNFLLDDVDTDELLKLTLQELHETPATVATEHFEETSSAEVTSSD